MTPQEREPSQRAMEEVADLLEQVRHAMGLRDRGEIRFRIDGSGPLLDEDAARLWLLASVDSGYARIGFAIADTPEGQVVDLAAYEDPPSQYVE